MKTQSKSPLRKAIEKLINEYSETEILSELISICERETYFCKAGKNYILGADIDSLHEDMKLNLSCSGYNLIKAETLKEQLQIEESFKMIVPYYRQQETQIQIAY